MNLKTLSRFLGAAVTVVCVSSAALAADAPVQTPSQSQMKATLHNYVDLFNAGNADAVIALYADDATIEDPIGSPLKTGRAGVEAFVRGVITRGVKYELISPIGSSNIDVAEMAIRAHSGATLLNVIELYTFDGAGKITSMKAYWGSEDREKAQ